MPRSIDKYQEKGRRVRLKPFNPFPAPEEFRPFQGLLTLDPKPQQDVTMTSQSCRGVK